MASADQLALDPRHDRHDLATGTWHDAAGQRLVYAPAELLVALLEVLATETGDGWKIALSRAGESCGRELAASPAPGNASLAAHDERLRSWFARHGWGSLTVDLTEVAAHGLVVARLERSLLPSLAPALSDPQLDAFCAGVLAGYFSALSNRELGCLEVSCTAAGEPRCVFVVSSPARLEAIDGHIGQLSVDEVISELKLVKS